MNPFVTNEHLSDSPLNVLLGDRVARVQYEPEFEILRLTFSSDRRLSTFRPAYRLISPGPGVVVEEDLEGQEVRDVWVSTEWARLHLSNGCQLEVDIREETLCNAGPRLFLRDLTGGWAWD